MAIDRPRVLGIGGTMAHNSTSAKALELALHYATEAGADTDVLVSGDLDLPNYQAGSSASPKAERFLALVRGCDALIISTPAYHGSMSGMIKNALDFIEDLRADKRPYLSGRAVGIIVTSYGDQAMGTTLANVRSVIHALRGWPTPVGVAINSQKVGFDPECRCMDHEADARLRLLAGQVTDFARTAEVA